MKHKLIVLATFLILASSASAQLKIPIKIDTANAKMASLYHFIDNYMNQDTFTKEYWHPKYQNNTSYYNYNNFIEGIWRGYKPAFLKENFHIKITELDTINDTLSYFKILFYSKDTVDNYVGLYKYYITQINGKYYLDNCIDYETSNFYTFKTNNIIFHLSPFFKPDTLAMMKASQQVDSLCSVLQKGHISKPFSYYMCSNQNELLKMCNIETSEVYVGGFTNMEARYIVALTNKPFYAHEFIHVILGNGANNFITGEGTASLYGGISKETSFIQGLNELKECYKTERCNFDNLYTRKVANLRNNNPTYAFAAVFCRYIINAVGLTKFYTLYYDKGLNNTNFMDKVAQLTKKSKEEIKNDIEKIIQEK